VEELAKNYYLEDLGVNEKNILKLVLKNRDERESGVDGRIILNWIFEKWDGSMDSIGLAQDRGKWQAVMNLWVPSSAGHFSTIILPMSYCRSELLNGVSWLVVCRG
jgi:hypothetical protein